MIDFLGGLALALIIGALGYAGFRAMTAAAYAQLPQPARGKVKRAGKAAARPVIEPVRHIRARAMAEVKAQHWLERKQAAMAKKQARHTSGRPSGWARTGSAVLSGARGAGMAARSAGRGMASGAGWVRSRTGRTAPSPATAPAAPAGAPLASSPVPAASAPAPYRTPASSPPPVVTAGRSAVATYGVPSDHAAVAARVGSFDPEDDGELLGFLTAEAKARQVHAEAIEHLHEHLTAKVGLDPVALNGLSECAQSASEDAARWAAAAQNFAARYRPVREFAAAGGVLPHDGRFLTGEDA